MALADRIWGTHRLEASWRPGAHADERCLWKLRLAPGRPDRLGLTELAGRLAQACSGGRLSLLQETLDESMSTKDQAARTVFLAILIQATLDLAAPHPNWLLTSPFHEGSCT